MTISPDEQMKLYQLRARIQPFHASTVKIEQAVDRRKADRENAARNGYSEHRIATRGVGLVRVASPLMFHIPFVDEPHFTTGSALVSNPKPLVWLEPYATLGVRMWVRNKKGHYVGAHVYIKVNVDANVEGGPGTDIYPDVSMVHFCTFSGLGFKDLGSALTAQAASIRPRVPGFGSNQ